VHVGGTGGRSVRADYSLVDFNRGGTPLVEIVSKPDIRSADQAKRFLQLLRQTVIELGISDAEMEKGTLRADANVSVRTEGESGYRTRTELKNMNSFTFIARGIEAEVARQIALYEAGGEVVLETYDYDADTNQLTPHRAKEEADDYRYFPEPDLVPMEPPRELVERLRAELPELPGARIRRFEEHYGLPYYDAEILNGSPALAGLFEGVVAAGADAKAASNVLMNQFAASGVDPGTVESAELAKLIEARERIPRATFLEALAASGERGFSADRYLADGLVGDVSELEPLVERILASNQEQVAAYRGGKEGLLGFFVGQVMKETQGKADPKVVNELLRAKLEA
jgi:aspartyl-tRNA(Asn)/glutamyl-tRNA(Gln) amidotransferase subunit B